MTWEAPGLSAWGAARLAAALLAIDPVGLGGIRISGPFGPARDKLLEGFESARAIPPHITEERLLGGLDLAATLAAGKPVRQRGTLEEAQGGVIVLSSAERLDANKAALIAAAMDAAPFALIACDEAQGDEEGLAKCLRERMAFDVETKETTLEDVEEESWSAADIEGAKARLGAEPFPEPFFQTLCETCLALGIPSLRAATFAVKAARALAALDGRDRIVEEDVAMAARLVLSHRATRYPAPQEEQPPETPPPPDDTRCDGGEEQSSTGELSDVLLEAVKAALPPGVLDMLRVSARVKAAKLGSGAFGQRAKAKRGRPAGTRAGDPRRGERLSLIETLRAAAPWQRLRNRPYTEQRIRVLAEDFRVTRFKPKEEAAAIFAVDASGSAAFARLAEAKGAVELILADCYIRRDRAALVAFRGTTAETLLPPTRSLQRAKRALAGLPGGGGTPLALGIEAAFALADSVRRGGATPMLVFLTDGRANIARDGTPGRARAEEDALAAARLIRGAGIKALVVDVSPRPGESARKLAAAMSAHYLPLPHANAHAISGAVRAAR
jgi:magnesium chelatase subunit D